MELIRKTYAKNKFCENKHFGKEAFAVPLGLLSDGVLWHVPSAEYHRLRDASVPPLLLQMLILSLKSGLYAHQPPRRSFARNSFLCLAF